MTDEGGTESELLLDAAVVRPGFCDSFLIPYRDFTSYFE